MKQEEYEHTRIVIDYIKHMNTLSTGSLVLPVTFLDRVFTQPKIQFAVVISLLGFMFSILGAVSALTVNAASPMNEDKKNWASNFETGGVFIMWAGFLIGVLSLTIFGVINLV